MRKRILSVLLPFILGSGAAHAYDVSGWDVQPVAVDGKFIGCSMAADYDRGTRAGLMVIPREGWVITLTNRDWNLQKGYTTPANVIVDGRTVASGTAEALDKNFLVLPLEGADAYNALQRGYGMRIQTRAGTVNLSLTGTRNAMDAVLSCVQSNRQAWDKPAPAPKQQPTNDLAAVPGSQALVLVTNMLASAGLTGYRVDPPKDDLVSWTLANGVRGGLIAFRNFRGEPEEGAAELIKSMSSNCRGDFVSAKKSTPTYDGSIVRKLVTACTEGGERNEAYITLIQQSDLLLIMYHNGPTGSGGGDRRSPAAEADDMLVRAVLAKGR
jgi:hypothetical protein